MPWRRWEITEPHSSSLGPRRSTFMPARGTSPSRRTRPTRTFLEALDESDDRAFDVRVAGPSALLVAKLHKLSDRAHEPGSKRLKDKDALDVLRLLRASPMETLVSGVRRLLGDQLCLDVTREAVEYLRDLFSTPGAPGSQMVVRATARLEDPVAIARSCAVLATELLLGVR